MKRSRRGVAFLLCLGILASTSFGTLSAFAAEWSIDDLNACEMTYPAIAGKDTVLYTKSEGGTVVLKATQSGYYAFFNVANSDWYIHPEGNAEFVSIGLDTEIKFTDVDAYIAENAKEFKANDVVVDTAASGGLLYCAYKASATDSFKIYNVDATISSLDEDLPQRDLLDVSTVEANDVKVRFHVGLDSEVTSSSVYLEKDGVKQEVYTASSADKANHCFDFTAGSNGNYIFTADTESGLTWSETFEVSCIVPGAADPDNPAADDTDGIINLTYTLSNNATGLSADNPITLNVKADRKCNFSCDGFPVTNDSDSADFLISENGIYTIYASDTDGLYTGSVQVTIRNFGDGTLPGEKEEDDSIKPPPDGDGVPEEDRDDYYKKQNEDPTKQDGAEIVPLSDDKSVKPSDGMTALPQTGITSWIAMLACAVGAIALGTLLMFRKGIFERFFKKGGSR